MSPHPIAVGEASAATPAIDAVRIEECSLNALQTARQRLYDGWLLRLAPGKARRARSVNPHFGSTLPLARKIAWCEAVYARHALPTLFRITPFAQPAELDAALARRGYVAFERTLVQVARLSPMPAAGDEGSIRVVDAATFAEVVSDLRGSDDAQRAGLRERLVQSSMPARFVVLEEGEGVTCAGQIVVDDDVAGVFDVVTADAGRGRGLATRLVASLLARAWDDGARVAYLQVNDDNAAALAVYAKFGFVTQYAYHYRARPGEAR